MADAKKEKAARQSAAAEEAPAAILTNIEDEMALVTKWQRALPHQIQRKAQLQYSIHFEYVDHLAKITIFLGTFFLTPVTKPTSNILY